MSHEHHGRPCGICRNEEILARFDRIVDQLEAAHRNFGSGPDLMCPRCGAGYYNDPLDPRSLPVRCEDCDWSGALSEMKTFDRDEADRLGAEWADLQ
jgi:hypothetical protein